LAGALEGVRVIDAAAVIAAPFGATLLGDFGAEVIKVEMPGTGDSARAMGPFGKGQSLRWPTFGRNKKSISLDLRKEKGKEIFLRLVAKSDVVFENFRTGTLDKWGLDYETLKKANPKIIVVRITGYGQTGPYAGLAGFGTPATAFSGLTYITGYADKPPVNQPISLADYLAGLYAAFAAMICLYYRDAKQGNGQEVDMSLYEGIIRMLEGHMAEYAVNGVVPERTGGFSGVASPAGIFRTKDGKWVVLVCSTQRTFEYFAQGIGRPELIQDERFITNQDRVANEEVMQAIVNDWMSQHDYNDVKTILDQAGAPVSLVYSMADIFADPHYKERENLVEVFHPTLGKMTIPGIVPKLSATPGEIKWIGPDLGAHNREIYEDLLGVTSEELKELKADGVI